MIRYFAILATCVACSTHDGRPCDLGTFVVQIQAEDRKIIGRAADYPADTMLRARDAELAASQAARREVAWQMIAKVLGPVDIATDIPGVGDQRLPRWATWYGERDLDRMFFHLYEGLGADGRAARTPFTDDALDEAFEWNTTAVDELPGWTNDRWLDYVAAVDDAERLAGIGGIDGIHYDAPAARHLLASYREIVACMADGPPGAFADGPSDGTRRVMRDTASMDRCQQRSYGPFFVAGGETLRASVETAGRVELVVREGAVPGDEVCRDDGALVCEVQGPGPYTVEINTLDSATDIVVVVEYDEAQPLWAACLDGAFDVDAVMVKTRWARAQFGFQLPVYDSSAEWLEWALATEMPDWGGADVATADPGPAEIYTLTLPNGNTYRLPAIHVMTKELDHWVWVTLWWSPDPDTDFGADRPASIAALGGPWRNYKMCVATMFDERDPDPQGGFGTTAPTLAAALAAVYRGQGGPSWCSNPYLEVGPGNANTNCIGCHQHGGVGVELTDILGDSASFPANGRTWLRNNFPHDYTFTVDRGDRMGRYFLDVIEWYEAFE